MKKCVTVAVVLCLGMLITACSGGTTTSPQSQSVAVASQSSASAPTSTPSPAGTPAPPVEMPPVVMSQDEAADYYLDWICYLNKAQANYTKLISGTPFASLATARYRKKAADASVIYTKVAKALDEPPSAWPEGTTRDVRKVYASVVQERAGLLILSKAKSAAAAENGWKTFSDSSNKSAQVLRARLGLPPAGGKYDGCKGRGSEPTLT